MRALPFVFALTATCAWCDTAKFSVLVVDSVSKSPLREATVKAWFETDIGWRAWNEPTPYITDTQTSDERGLCRMTGKTNTGTITCWVEKAPNGYYKAFGRRNTFKSKSFFGTWQPDNLVVTVALDRVEKPIPLYVKQAVFPSSGKAEEKMAAVEKGAFSYDFVKGDWLPPWGHGEFADVVFRRLPREDLGQGMNFCGETDAAFKDVVAVDFNGPGNGIVAVPVSASSELKIRASVEGGFVVHYELSAGVGKDLKVFRSRDESKCLCFRVRTKYDEAGKIVEAYYGKIYGDIGMGWSYQGVSSVSFLYYFNPTPNDRNLEWDMKNNLCFKPGDLRRLQP